MSTPNLNPTPRARFQATAANITQHRAMIERPSFDASTDAAMLEYQRLCAEQVRDGNTGMMSGIKLQGALEFLGILKTLAEPAPVLNRAPISDNLPDLSGLKRAN